MNQIKIKYKDGFNRNREFIVHDTFVENSKTYYCFDANDNQPPIAMTKTSIEDFGTIEGLDQTENSGLENFKQNDTDESLDNPTNESEESLKTNANTKDSEVNDE